MTRKFKHTHTTYKFSVTKKSERVFAILSTQLCCEYRGSVENICNTCPPCWHLYRVLSVVMAGCASRWVHWAHGSVMTSVMLGARGQRLGLLQLAARATADSSEEAFSGWSRRGGVGETEEVRGPMLFLSVSPLKYSTLHAFLIFWHQSWQLSDVKEAEKADIFILHWTDVCV